MMRYLLAALILTGCGCSGAPIVPDAQMQLASIADAYGKARAVELDHCPGAPKCEDVRRAGYGAEGSYVVANGERTASAINEARAKVGAYSKAAGEL